MKVKKRKKIYLVSSGTGGHAAPILSLYRELIILPNVEPLILHTGSEIETNLFKKTKNKKIVSRKFDRDSIFKRLVLYPLVFVGFFQTGFLMLFSRPSLVISKGGYGAVPVLFATRLFKIPFFLHESDSHLGLANKMFAGSAAKVFLGFPKDVYNENVKNEKYQYIGQIIEKFPSIKKDNKKVIYFTGGSQGAESINKIVYKIVSSLSKDYLVYHQVGGNNLSKANEIKGKIENENYKVFGFEYNKAREAMTKADLVVARAGANTIGEIAKNKKASILIPYPYAANDHQIKNAKYLEKNGSALLVLEKQLNKKYLLERIKYIMSGNNAEVLGRKIFAAIKTDGLEALISEIRKKLGV